MQYGSKSFPLKLQVLQRLLDQLKTGYVKNNFCLLCLCCIQHSAHNFEMSHRLRFLICDIDHNEVTCIASVECGYIYIQFPVWTAFVCLLPFIVWAVYFVRKMCSLSLFDVLFNFFFFLNLFVCVSFYSR